jgi:hypothetical protein
MGTKLLRKFAEFRGMHPDRKRATWRNCRAARTSTQAVQKGALGVGHARFID